MYRQMYSVGIIEKFSCPRLSKSSSIVQDLSPRSEKKLQKRRRMSREQFRKYLRFGIPKPPNSYSYIFIIQKFYIIISYKISIKLNLDKICEELKSILYSKCIQKSTQYEQFRFYCSNQDW